MRYFATVLNFRAGKYLNLKKAEILNSSDTLITIRVPEKFYGTRDREIEVIIGDVSTIRNVRLKNAVLNSTLFNDTVVSLNRYFATFKYLYPCPDIKIGNKKALCVRDNDTLARILVPFFEENGYREIKVDDNTSKDIYIANPEITKIYAEKIILGDTVKIGTKYLKGDNEIYLDKWKLKTVNKIGDTIWAVIPDRIYNIDSLNLRIRTEFERESYYFNSKEYISITPPKILSISNKEFSYGDTITVEFDNCYPSLLKNYDITLDDFKVSNTSFYNGNKLSFILDNMKVLPNTYKLNYSGPGNSKSNAEIVKLLPFDILDYTPQNISLMLHEYIVFDVDRLIPGAEFSIEVNGEYSGPSFAKQSDKLGFTFYPLSKHYDHVNITIKQIGYNNHSYDYTIETNLNLVSFIMRVDHYPFTGSYDWFYFKDDSRAHVVASHYKGGLYAGDYTYDFITETWNKNSSTFFNEKIYLHKLLFSNNKDVYTYRAYEETFHKNSIGGNSIQITGIDSIPQTNFTVESDANENYGLIVLPNSHNLRINKYDIKRDSWSKNLISIDSTYINTAYCNYYNNDSFIITYYKSNKLNIIKYYPSNDSYEYMNGINIDEPNTAFSFIRNDKIFYLIGLDNKTDINPQLLYYNLNTNQFNTELLPYTKSESLNDIFAFVQNDYLYFSLDSGTLHIGVVKLDLKKIDSYFE